MRTKSLCELIFLLAFSILIFGLNGCGGGGGGGGTPPSGDPAPASVALSEQTSATSSSVGLTWGQSGESDFASYKVYRSTSSGVSRSSTLATTITSKATTTFTVSGLSADTIYYFKVYVCDTASQCTGSNEVIGGTQANSIVCGNGALETGEQCDDGNTISGDGCSSSCTTESSSANTWAKTFGGLGNDGASSVQQTTDGGFIVAGYTISYGAGVSDLWVLKLDSSGNQIWSKTFGGSGSDVASSVQQTTDGGFIVAGYTGYYGAGSLGDMWVLKLDSSGNQVWAKTFGGTEMDLANSVQQTTDGGFIVAGYKSYSGTSSLGYMWVLKLDSSGNQVWAKTFGGTGATKDAAESIQQTTDGGYIVAGGTCGTGCSIRVLKLDSSGNQVWSKIFGGSGTGMANSVQQTTDGGFIVAGYTSSYLSGSYDFWVLKLDSSGNQIWSNKFGGLEGDGASSVQQTTDGGFIVAGYTTSYGAGGGDMWVLKLDSSGNQIWSKTYGGTETDMAYSIQQTSDGGFIVVGYTASYGAGGNDLWVLKLNASGNCPGCF